MIGEFALKTAAAMGCSYAEARIESTSSNGFILKNGNPEMSGFERSQGIGIRLVKNGSLSFISTNQLEKEKIKWLIKRTVRRLDAARQLSEKVKLDESRSHKKSYKARQKINLKDVSAEERFEVLFDIEKTLNRTKASLPGRYISLSDEFISKEVLTTEGTRIYSEIPRISFFHMITIANQGKSTQRYWQFGASTGFEAIEKWDIENKMAREIISLSKNLKEGRKAKKGILDVVVGPEVTGIIAHESCGHPYEADRILGREAAQAGESFMKKSMIGKRFSDEAVSVADDPTLRGSFGYYLYDDEGVKARKKLLIKDGIINELLHNRQTAHTMNMDSNGSSRASNYDREAIIRMSNTFFVPGRMKEEELFQEIRKGIYIKNFTEWNIDDKRLNQKYVGAESYMIENGKITKPIINPSIEITTPRLYKSIDAVANNLELHSATCGKGEPMQGIPVTIGGPSIRLRKIRIG